MTPEERAERLAVDLGLPVADVVEDIAAEIRAAVEEEREACAGVAQSHRYFEITDPDTGEIIGGDMPDAMRRMMDWVVGKTVAAAIRARGDG